MSNKIIAANGKLFIAWLDHVADIVIQTCDLETGSWGDRVLLGKGVDNHCGPAITMDSEGYLYAMFGPHNDAFQFRRSVRSYDATEWQYVPTGFTCPDGMSTVGETFTWDEARALDVGTSLDALRLHSLQGDTSNGDYSDLYRLNVWVR